MNGVPPYSKRHFQFLDVWQIQDIQLKAYLVTVDPIDDLPGSIIASAYRYTLKTLPEVRMEEGKDHGLGYVIIHPGMMATWLLIHWWAHEDVAMRLLAAAETGNEKFVSNNEKRFHACVWEHVVIDHERNAWVENVMRTGGTAGQYLGDRLSDGAY
ncbi:MAG: hypothetical protein AAF870_04050 [Pseudomonadota bacterium]